MKRFLIFTLTALLFVSVFSFAGCGETPKPEVDKVDYSSDNNYDYEMVSDDDFVTYTPNANATKGLLFYLGTAIAPEHYDYLASALAKQGYLVVISTNGFPYVFYDDDEPTFDKYPNVDFYVGGHSQGGGAAVKRAKENPDKVKGLVLLAPLAYAVDSVADSTIPTLLLEATKDGVLTSSMKAEAKTCLPENRTEYLIEGCHMSFSTYDNDTVLSLFKDGPASAEVRQNQKNLTVEYVLAFLKSLV